MKAGQGVGVTVILKMNQQVMEINVMRCRRDTDSFKSFVYTPSAVLGLSWFVFLYHFHFSALLHAANLEF
jgi:hypothetical protein